MARKVLKSLEKNKTAIHLKYGSNFSDTHKKLFEKMRNCYRVSEMLMWILEYAMATFNYDVDEKDFEDLFIASKFCLTNGCIATPEFAAFEQDGKPQKPRRAKRDIPAEAEETEEPPKQHDDVNHVETKVPAKDFDPNETSEEELLKMMSV